MNKTVSWKGSLLIALILYTLKFTLGAYLPAAIVAIFEITGLITLVLGMMGALKAFVSKRKKKT